MDQIHLKGVLLKSSSEEVEYRSRPFTFSSGIYVERVLCPKGGHGFPPRVMTRGGKDCKAVFGTCGNGNMSK